MMTTAVPAIDAAHRFILANARLIDRAIHARVCLEADEAHVRRALLGYRNDDGGFGHALEPDVRAPASQPLHTITALELLHDAGIRDPALADRCCEFAQAVAERSAALPALLAGALDHPAARHWHGTSALEPSPMWTWGLVAQLCWHGATHPWLDVALRASRNSLSEPLPREAHALLYAARFAGSALADTERGPVLNSIREALPSADYFVAEPPVTTYGLSPLHFAPHPDDPMRSRFDDATIERHLDYLQQAQLEDGGWPTLFQPPSPAALLEWRGRSTVEALITLRAYGRLPA